MRALVLLLLSSTALADEPRLLVLPLKAEPGLESTARALDEMVLDALFALGRFQVLGASDLNALVGAEKMKDAAGCDDVACAAEIGGALGTPYIVAGQLTKLGDQTVLSLRWLDTRVPKVVGRASARGGSSAQALDAMLQQTVKTLFGTPPPAAAAPSTDGFTELMQRLAKRLSAMEYSALLDDIAIARKNPPAAPAGMNTNELLTFYEATACSTLKRPCFQDAAKRYLATWPDGTYHQSIESYVSQAENEALQRENKLAELPKRLEEIEGRKLTKEQAEEQRAWAYFGADQFDEAAKRLLDVRQTAADEERWFQLTESISLCYERAARFDEARKTLTEAQTKNERTFKLKRMNDTLRRLPK